MTSPNSIATLPNAIHLFWVYVMGGDFNCTLDPIRDRSSGLDQSHKQTRKTLQYFIKT